LLVEEELNCYLDVVYLLVEVMNIKDLILQEEVKVGIMWELEEQLKEEVHVKLKKWLLKKKVKLFFDGIYCLTKVLDFLKLFLIYIFFCHVFCLSKNGLPNLFFVSNQYIYT